MFNKFFLLSGRSAALAVSGLLLLGASWPVGLVKAEPASEIEQSNASRKLPGRRVPRRTGRPRGRQSRMPAPPNRLPPNRVQPGGGLSVAATSCEAERPLTALVPVENPVFTESGAPSFLFYFPDDPAVVDYAEFVLLSADEKEQIYSERFVPDAPGIASVSLPAGSEMLAVDEAYHWYLNVHCVDATVLTVDGWAQRMASANGVESEGALPVVWYDAIAAAGEEMAMAGSGEVRQQWERWLTAAGLEALVDEPVLGEVGE